ncbi:MAG: SNF2-related protein [Rhodococcus sp. (in: high G+C Gram-positive bacteria)]
MTPFETVLAYYRFPERIVPHPLQIEAINDLAPKINQGHWLDMGVGKTFIATAVMLYHKIVHGHQGVVIMPPILIRQWARWLAEITPAVTITEYRGTPDQRKGMGFDNDFVLTGVQIFKKDYEKFVTYFSGRHFTTTVDEAAPMVSNVESANHQRIYEFSLAHPQLVLSGTPMNDVMGAYGLMKFSAPGTYRNLAAFTNDHVESVDFYKKPTGFKNLEMLRENMLINSKRVLFQDVFKNTETPLFEPIYYDLEKAHYKLYTKLAEEQLLLLPDGGKIDGTTANKLTHALGQIVCNYGHFSGKDADVASVVEMIEQKLTELGTGRLVVFAHYKRTVATLKERLKRFGAVTINSEVTEAQKEKHLQRFMNDPSCRVIVMQFISGGKGLDGLQHVCNHIFFAEPCQQPRDFHQAVARLHRLGQKNRVHVMMGIANGTTQVRGFKNLLVNDSVVAQVIRTAYELRKVIFGN